MRAPKRSRGGLGMDALKCIIWRGAMFVRITLRRIALANVCWIGPCLASFQVTLAGHCCCRRGRRSPHAGCSRTSARGGGTALAVSNKGATPVSRAACSGRLTLASDVWRRVQEAFGSPKGVYHLDRLQKTIFRDPKAYIERTAISDVACSAQVLLRRVDI